MNITSTDQRIASIEADAAKLADTLREIASNIDPKNHVYRMDDCDPDAEWGNYRRQADDAFRMALP